MLKILWLRTLIGNLCCDSLIEGLFMERMNHKDPPIFNTFLKLVKSNFCLNSLDFSFFTKFINFCFLFFFLTKQVKEFASKFSSSSKHFALHPQVTTLRFNTWLVGILKLQLTPYTWVTTFWYTYLRVVKECWQHFVKTRKSIHQNKLLPIL